MSGGSQERTPVGSRASRGSQDWLHRGRSGSVGCVGSRKSQGIGSAFGGRGWFINVFLTDGSIFCFHFTMKQTLPNIRDLNRWKSFCA